MPRIALLGADAVAVHGARSSRSVAISSNRSPLGSLKPMTGSPKCASRSRRDRRRLRKRDRQNSQRRRRHGERRRHDLAGALGADAHAIARVRKRRPDRARRAELVAVIEVVDVVVVEVDGLLDQPQAKQLDAEVEIGLRLVHGRGDVMQAKDRWNRRSTIASDFHPRLGNEQLFEQPHRVAIGHAGEEILRRHVHALGLDRPQVEELFGSLRGPSPTARRECLPPCRTPRWPRRSRRPHRTGSCAARPARCSTGSLMRISVMPPSSV